MTSAFGVQGGPENRPGISLLGERQQSLDVSKTGYKTGYEMVRDTSVPRNDGLFRRIFPFNV